MTDQYAVFGSPLKHTKSPRIHQAFAAATAQAVSYVAIEPPPDGFTEAALSFRARGGKGINITAPFKLEAYAMATVREQRASLAGASNALKFDGSDIIAENFDGVGLVRDIRVNLESEIEGRRVLLMGAGGAARGAILTILECQPSKLMVANRTVSKAEALRELFRPYGKIEALGYPDLGNRAFDIVINATSASLFGEVPVVSSTVFGSGCLVYELVYGKGLTPFLSFAKASGVTRLSDGGGMLVEQAAEAFAWWRGIRPPTKEMIKDIRIPLI